MPVEGLNTVRVGQICFSCLRREIGTCPYGNHKRTSSLTFVGDPGTGRCNYYEPLPDEFGRCGEEDEKMKKISAKNMRDSQLNMELFKKIMAMSEPELKRFLTYWGSLFGKEYAQDMADKEDRSVQRSTSDIIRVPEMKKKKDKKDKKKK